MDKESDNYGALLQPTKFFYQNFTIYTPSRRCKECGRIIKNKRPNVNFVFKGFVRGSSDMIRVKITGKKNIWRLHKKYFMPFD